MHGFSNLNALQLISMWKDEFCFFQLDLNATLELIIGVIPIPEISLFAKNIAIQMRSHGMTRVFGEIWCSIPVRDTDA